MIPVVISLDEGVQRILEAEAESRRLGLPEYLREVATEAANRVKRERIREQSRSVGAYVARSPEAAAFYEDWGSSNPIISG